MKTTLLILHLIPSFLEIVKAIEAAIPVAGAGQAKKDVALRVTEAAYRAQASQTSGAESWETIAPAVSKVVDSFVDGANATGVFSTSPVKQIGPQLV